MKAKNSKKSAKTRRPRATTTTLPSILKILATTDFSQTSQCGVRYAISLADKLGSTVALLHVMEPRSWLSELGSIVPVREDSKVVASARAHLEALGKREGQGEVAVTCSVSVRTGNPFHAIITAALERAADLIVIATHGHTGGERFLLGSIAERVVRHAPCPVLTVPARTKPRRRGTPPFKLRIILVPIDFSKLSTDALPWAGLLSAHLGAKIVLLHVVQSFPIDFIPARDRTNDAFVTIQAEAALKQLAGSLSKSMGVNVSAVVSDGNPFEVICQTAKTLGADMIVQTTHGYTGLKHVLLGSTAERVVRYAPCPVLSVRGLNRKKL